MLIFSQSIQKTRFVSKLVRLATTISLTGAAIISAPSAQATYASAPTCSPLLSVINGVSSITLDAQSNPYVLRGRGRVEQNILEKIDRNSGQATLIAGGWQRNIEDGNLRIGMPGFYGEGIPAIDSGIFWPEGVTFDSSGNIYISDTGIFQNNNNGNRIRKISTNGLITTFAGKSGNESDKGYTGNDGLATNAKLFGPTGIVSNSSGDIFFIDARNFVIRKITHGTNIISTVAGTGLGAGSDNPGNSFQTSGVATEINLHWLNSLGIDTTGNLYFIDMGGYPSQSGLIQKLNVTTNQISTILDFRGDIPANKVISGNGGLASEVRYLRRPAALTIDSHNNIYFTDSYGAAIRRISASDEKISTIAGTGDWEVSGVKSNGTSALTQNIGVSAMAVAPDGKVYFNNENTISVLDQSTGKASYLSGGFPTDVSDEKLSPFCGSSPVTAGSEPNSRVATIPSGVTIAAIPATTSLPATTLNFGGTVPTSVTVVPVLTNPAASSATPFTISNSTKIVDIQVADGFSGTATVCLEGSESDHIFHYTGGAWVELPSRSYIDGQVCGVTDSFSPFAAAPPAAALRSTSAAEAAAIAAAAAAKREAEIKAARNEIANKLAKSQSLTLDSFKKAEISGVTAENFTAVQAEILALPIESRAEISQVLKIARKYEVIGKIASNQASTLPISAFVDAGLLTPENKNKTTLIAAVKRAPESERSSFASIQAVIAEAAAKIKERKDRLAATISRIKSR